MTENDVLTYLATYLRGRGYSSVTHLTTSERGVDLVGILPGGSGRLLVEAKGATSSKERTSRYGQPFTRNQVKTHVSAAFFCGAKLREECIASGTVGVDRIALAFPDDALHRGCVRSIEDALKTLGMTVYFVATTGAVCEAAA